jgi:hypothetical protein
LPQTTARSTDYPATAAKPVKEKSAGKPGLAAAQQMRREAERTVAKHAAATAKPSAKKSVDKPTLAATRPVTKPVRLAKVDPLAPLPAKHSNHSKEIAAER